MCPLQSANRQFVDFVYLEKSLLQSENLETNGVGSNICHTQTYFSPFLCGPVITIDPSSGSLVFLQIQLVKTFSDVK